MFFFSYSDIIWVKEIVFYVIEVIVFSISELYGKDLKIFSRCCIS